MPSSQTMSYKYNADGIRTQKTFTDNAVKYYYKHDYILDGAKVVAETITYFTYFGTNTTEVLYYYYDEAGAPTGIKYNNNVYYFQKNLQGDIIRILNSSGTIVATYTYDAWGNIIASTDTSGVSIGTKNPFRYRGYYYDTETGLYYLNSRYYDPQVGRFLNADGFVSTGQGLLGSNMFAYCENNPIKYYDPTGSIGILAILGLLGIGAMVLCIPSSESQVPYYQSEAKKKYNNNTVHVYKSEMNNDVSDKFNVRLYDAGTEKQHTNIQINDSLSVNNAYEMEAILDVVINSDYYSEERFGTKSFMKSQWLVHNWCYDIASFGRVGFFIAKLISRNEDPIGSSEELDIRSKDNFGRMQKFIYTIVSWFV